MDRKPLAGTRFETEIDGDKAQFDVIVSAEGYKSKAARVTLVPGKSFVHNVTLEKATTAPTPVAKDPAPTKPAGKPKSVAELTKRVIEAHAWNAFQKLTSVRVTGSAKMTSPDPEGLRAFVTTMTPSGNFHLSFVGNEGKIEMGGTPLTSWTKQNGNVLPFEIPGGKALFYPQGVLGAVGGALNDTSIAWTMSGGGDAPYVLTYSEASGSLKATIDPVTFRLRSAELSVLNQRSVCTVQRYEVVQGVPIPMTIAVDNYLGGDRMSILHTYAKAEPNVAVKPNFHEAN